MVSSQGELTSFTPQGNGQNVVPDLVNARPMPLPRAAGPFDITQSLLPPQYPGTPGFASGEAGNGQTNPITLPLPAISYLDVEAAEPDQWGTSNQPFSIARADLFPTATNTQYPYSASGKLAFQKPDNTWWLCSASMVKRGVVVTAAHCVANYGASTFYRNGIYFPGYRNGSLPFGYWTVSRAYILTAYYNGTDSCYQYGVICPDDVAVLILNPDGSGTFAGSYTGWYGYGYNGYGFVSNSTQITQIGYPSCLDNGQLMERNDSRGFVSNYSSNTIIGSLMAGGSSGGPWLNNFGIRPTLTGGVNGTAPDPNIVVGVTSWVSTNPYVLQEGASPFTSNNIANLITSACNSRPTACQ